MKQPSITSLPPSPEAERRARMIKYTIAMSVRVVCLVLMLFVHGWWQALCVAGAIILPYVAVVLANVGTTAPAAEVISPGALVPLREQPRMPDSHAAEPDVSNGSAPWPDSDENKRSA
ncbi:DUF3099 domain-containing protein [Mycetocola zhadangensis]|uniref:DUF3099 domain-containing protein n=1 Tax=Mycetocola zhadangensis TaxID=1164595 RepID=A0A3L7J7A1_9MICO|nr:DUF3099 domain-containing protein [Mycetocola zhadangensis]RLQ86225.1 DUF3099 domain-containing protein [Mycetocola zhadangensis]